MPQQILIFHAADTYDRSESLRWKLSRTGFVATTLNQLNKSESGSIYRRIQQAIEKHDKIIIMVSKGIFDSCVLRFGVGYALGRAKLVISMERKEDNILVPSWYSEVFKSVHNEAELWAKLKS